MMHPASGHILQPEINLFCDLTYAPSLLVGNKRATCLSVYGSLGYKLQEAHKVSQRTCREPNAGSSPYVYKF